MKLVSHLKALVESANSSKSGLSHWQNYVPISPKDQGDLSGLILPRVGANSWTPNVDYEYLQKIYDCHDLVHNCIELVSSTFALGKLKVKKKIDGKYRYLPNHPLQIVLDNPNSSMSGYDLRQSYVVHRLLNGTVAFLMIRGDQMVTDDHRNSCPECNSLRIDNCVHALWHFHVGPVTQIMPCHPDRLEKKQYDTPKGKKEYFLYNWDNGVKMLVHPNNIMTDPLYNPGGSFSGTSPTAQVQRWLEIDLGLSQQVGAYLANNSIPSMILNIKPPASGGHDQDPATLLSSIKEKWIRDFSMNGDGNKSGRYAKTPAFVYGEMDVHKIQDTLKEMVVKPLFYEIQNRVCMAYNVPPSFFEFGQDYGSQSTTIQQQEKNFFNRAISKNLISFKSKMERYVLSSYEDEDLVLDWDLSDMGAANFLEKDKKVQVLKEWELGLLTRDATREQLGYDPLGGDTGDDLYRITVMSDGNSNNSIMGGSLEDNRLKPDFELNQE